MSVWLSCKLYVRVSYTVRVCCICKHCSLPTLNRDMNTHHMTLPSLLVPLSAATIKILAAKFLPLLSPTLLPPAGWGGCIWGELCIALSQGEKKKKWSMWGGDARFPRTSQSMRERNLAQGPYANGGTSGNPGSRHVRQINGALH